MTYSEVIENYERLKQQSAQAKQKQARARIASANSDRSTAARRYQDDLKSCTDAIAKARAQLREGKARTFALRDRNNVLLGWIEAQGRLIQAKDTSGSVVGWYDPQKNVTRKKDGVLLGTGDLLSALVLCRL